MRMHVSLKSVGANMGESRDHPLLFPDMTKLGSAGDDWVDVLSKLARYGKSPQFRLCLR